MINPVLNLEAREALLRALAERRIGRVSRSAPPKSTGHRAQIESWKKRMLTRG